MPTIPYLGEVVSLLTAACWASTAVFFSRAGRRVGSAAVNVTRLGLALTVMLLLHTLLFGTPFPFQAGPVRLTWLALSGLIGFSLGDALYFESLVQLGPRLGSLIMTLWPAIAALLAWPMLHQTLSLPKLAAMLATLGGIALVVSEKTGTAGGPDRPRHYGRGILCGLGGAVGQAVGIIFSKFGMAGGLSPISANVVRVSTGFVILAAWQLARREFLSNLRKFSDRKALGLVSLGATFGPVIGVMLSLFAIKYASNVGIASTLMSLSPVMLLPATVLIDKEKLSLRAILGTLVSIGGVAAMFVL
jgi:drug/metabolite transporter (DMT)-like permease